MSYEFDKNTGTIIKFLGEEKELVIPSEIDNIEVKIIGEEAFDNYGLTKVVIPESIKGIRRGAFANNKLTSVKIPSSVKTIGYNAFEENDIKELVIEGNESRFNYMWSMIGFPFSCMPGIINENGILVDDDKIVDYIGTAKSVVIPNEIKGTNIKIIVMSAFAGKQITSIDIPENIVSIRYNALAKNPLKTIKLKSNINDIAYDFIDNLEEVIYNLGKNIGNFKSFEVVETLVTLLKKYELTDEVSIIEALRNYLEFEDEYELLASSKKKKERKVGEHLLKDIEIEKVINKPVLDQLDVIKKSITKEVSDKMKLMDLSDIPKLRFKDGKEVDKEIVIACIGAFLSSNLILVPSENRLIEVLFSKEDLTSLAHYILSKWIDSGMDNKLKTLLVLSAYYADSELLYKIKALVNELISTKRYKAAQQILQAIAYNGSKYSFMLLDEISYKGKTKGQKEEAKWLLLKAAKINGISLDKLLDMIVPNFGFDDNGVLSLSNGETSIDILLENDGKVTFRNEAGKTVKTLPKSAECFKKEISTLKKQIKTTYNTQKSRIEQAFITGKRWDKETFINIFVTNPLVRQISSGLIFGFENEDGIKETFVITPEKILETVNYQKVNIDNIRDVYLMHSAEETKDVIEKWLIYFKENELKSNINQLIIKQFDLSEQVDDYHISKYSRYKMCGTSNELKGVLNKLVKIGFEKGDVEDAGMIFEMSLKLQAIDLEVKLSFMHGFGAVMDYTDKIEIENLEFINTQNLKRKKLTEVPKRVLSTVVYELDKIFN